MDLYLHSVKKYNGVETDQDELALTVCQKSQVESRQIKIVLCSQAVKRVSWSQGRSRWSSIYILSKEPARAKAGQDGLALTV